MKGIKQSPANRVRQKANSGPRTSSGQCVEPRRFGEQPAGTPHAPRPSAPAGGRSAVALSSHSVHWPRRSGSCDRGDSSRESAAMSRMIPPGRPRRKARIGVADRNRQDRSGFGFRKTDRERYRYPNGVMWIFWACQADTSEPAMKPLKARYDCIVIGGGHNGLVTAAYLARAGKSVCVLERRHVLGGCAVTEELWPGFRVSTAAYVISLFLPQIIRELKLKQHGLEILPRDPSSFTPLLDGRSLLLGPDHGGQSARNRQVQRTRCGALSGIQRALRADCQATRTGPESSCPRSAARCPTPGAKSAWPSGSATPARCGSCTRRCRNWERNFRRRSNC